MRSQNRKWQRCLWLSFGLIPGLVFSSTNNPGYWPAWRGPNANGSIQTGRYAEQWGPEAIAWKTQLPGKGGSSPIVHSGRIIVTTPVEGQDAVLALDSSGKQLWLTRLGPESQPKHQTLGSSCNASPVTDGTGIFVYFRSGLFAALEM